ncbi:MAG: type 2 isopentenyl-diphosphate Delta-isomerase [Oligoflexia bacterium]
MSQNSSRLDLQQFEERKRDHIDQSLRDSHQAFGLSGLDSMRLEHEALPELDLAEVSLSEPCLGAELATPFFVAAMTMGHAGAAELNHRLARLCQARGWAMGIGSQRRELESSPDFQQAQSEGRLLRKAAPHAVLFANIGISQVIEVKSAELQRLVDSIQAQALVIHLNALQEALQPEGTPRFKGGLKAIEAAVKAVQVPVVIKETGCGISESTVKRLAGAGIAAIDVSGLGGTHWGRIEGARSGAGSLSALASSVFADWGISTVQSVQGASKVLGQSAEARVRVWASGGVRNGLDAAKLIALGAHRVGFAQPALRAAIQSEEALLRWMEQIEFELKVALFCTGSMNPQVLRQREIRQEPFGRKKNGQ